MVSLAMLSIQAVNPPPPPALNQFAYVLSVDVGWPDMTWTDARDKCQENGMYLARIM